MLTVITHLEILIYLLISPVIRLFFDEAVDYNYYFLIFFIFYMGYVISIYFPFRLKGCNREHQVVINFTLPGKLVAIVFACLYIYISIKNGIVNRRLGTESMAVIFANLGLFDLAVLRIQEICFPIMLAFSLRVFISPTKISFADYALLFFLLLSWTFSGALFSRTAAIINILSVLLLLQNSISKAVIKKYSGIALGIGLLFFVVISAVRYYPNEEINTKELMFSEFAKRSDGLELSSLIVNKYGYSIFGETFSAWGPPIISAVPFLDEAKEFKENALTTAKSYILTEELDLPFKDYNSFVTTDLYLATGLFGLLVGGFLLGLFTKKFDASIGLNNSRISYALYAAFALNLMVMERDFSGIIIGTFRDFFIYYIFLCFLFSFGRKVYDQK